MKWQGAILLVLLLSLLIGCESDPGGPDSGRVISYPPERRAALPVFSLAAVQDGTQVRSENTRGRPILAAFFAPWCSSCVADAALLQDIHANAADPDLLVIGFAIVDDPADQELERFISKIGIEFPVLMSTEQLRRAFGGIGVVPTVFLVDRQGYIVKKYAGRLDRDVLLSDIATLPVGD